MWLLFIFAVLGYVGHSYKNNNPLYGAVLIWVLQNNYQFQKSENEFIILVYCAIIALITIFCVLSKVKGTTEYGLLY